MTEVVQQRGKTGIKRILKGKQGLSFWQEKIQDALHNYLISISLQIK